MYKDPKNVLGKPVIAGNSGVNASSKNALYIGINITIPYQDLVKQITDDGLERLLDEILKEISRRGLKK